MTDKEQFKAEIEPMEQKPIKILHLPLKAKWYRMIETGEKPEEYREITPYFMVRLFEMNDDEVTGNYRPMSKKTAQDIINHPECSEIISEAIECYDIRSRYTHVHFTLGYPRKDDAERNMVKKIKEVVIGTGRPEWGAEPGKEYFVIKFEK